MQSIITLENGQEIKIDNNLAWLMEYQNQFGEDILPTLMPLLLSFTDLIGGLAEQGVNFDDFGVNDIMKIFNSEAAMDAGIKLSTFKTTDIINIVWALAKAADDKIEPPKKWIRQFDEGFPMDIILPQAGAAVAKGVMSSKNFERLTEAMKRNKASNALQPKKNTKKKSK